jgi:Transposase DDE domain
MTEPWRIAMKAKLETDNAKFLYKKRKQTVEPVFGIIKNAMGFVRFRLRGLQNVATEVDLGCTRLPLPQNDHPAGNLTGTPPLCNQCTEPNPTGC